MTPMLLRWPHFSHKQLKTVTLLSFVIISFRNDYPYQHKPLTLAVDSGKGRGLQ